MSRDTVSERSTELFAAARSESPSEETRRRIALALRAQSEPRDSWYASIWEHRRPISFALPLASAAALTLVLLQSPETVDISAESLAQKSAQKHEGAKEDSAKSTVSTQTPADKAKTSPKISKFDAPPLAPADAAPAKAPQAPPSLEQELAGMQRARSTLKGGDAAGTLAELERFERKPGWRQLRVEASLLRIEALFELGKADESRAAEARNEALRFVEEHPNDPLVDRAAKFTQAESSNLGAPPSRSISSSRSVSPDDPSESVPSERE